MPKPPDIVGVVGLAQVARLRAAGIEVTLDPETYPNGRFARIHDPEGNPIELWEPLGT